MPAPIMDESTSFDVVTPANAGIQRRHGIETPGSRLRGDDARQDRRIDAISEA
jgi:hypothetical protein